VTEGQATTLLSATGYVEAERKADLSPKITSRITELNVTEGTRVKKGDVIARLDSTDLDAQLAEAKANWINAQAELERQKSLYAQGVSTKSAWTRPSPARPRRAPACVTSSPARLHDHQAPFAGVITAKRAFVGEAVSPTAPRRRGRLRRDRDAGRVLLALRGRRRQRSESSRSSANQPAEISLDAVPDKVYGEAAADRAAADRRKPQCG
jgi:multidrug efflux pump subunit AcrA (membrane-fusion protein)